MELKDIYGKVIFALESAKTVLELVTAARAAKADLRRADLIGANLRGSDLSGSDLRGSNLRDSDLSCALIDGKPIVTMRVFSGLYRYTVQAVLFKDGSRKVRMGCLWKSLAEWEAVEIRKSNTSEFPDDGSDRCEERVAAFEFAKAAALRLKENQ